MKSPKQTKLEPNPLHGGRKPGERLKVINLDDFDCIEVLPPPDEQDWKKAPGMPYDDGLANARTGASIKWTDEEEAMLARWQALGRMDKVVEMMTEKSKHGHSV